MNSKFYLIESLERDGFIHADGSLKLEFFIKKQNFPAQLRQLKNKFRKFELDLRLQDIEKKVLKVRRDDFGLISYVN